MTAEEREMDPRAEISPEAARLAELTRAGLPRLTESESESDWGRVQERLHAKVRRRRVRWLALTAGVAAALPALWLVLRTTAPAAALQFTVAGGHLAEGGRVVFASESAATLRFSDGTELELGRNAAGRLAAVGQHGASLVLERGSTRVRVVPLPEARWKIDAGPFAVEVKGTVFDVEWTPALGRLRVAMERGSVAVTGPLWREPMSLHGTQSLLVDLPRREVHITERDLAPTPDAASADGPTRDAGAAPPPGAAATGRTAASVRPAQAPSWATLFTEGKLDRILEEADTAGIDASLDRRSSPDLAALADAARYRGRTDLARGALLAQRTRFAGSVRAAEAAFLLGRLEESTTDGAPRALDWYDRYLNEAPSGRYAAEVLGRKMLVVRKVHGAERARPLALEYLRRHPGGWYADLARQIVRN